MNIILMGVHLYQDKANKMFLGGPNLPDKYGPLSMQGEGSLCISGGQNSDKLVPRGPFLLLRLKPQNYFRGSIFCDSYTVYFIPEDG